MPSRACSNRLRQCEGRRRSDPRGRRLCGRGGAVPLPTGATDLRQEGASPGGIAIGEAPAPAPGDRCSRHGLFDDRHGAAAFAGDGVGQGVRDLAGGVQLRRCRQGRRLRPNLSTQAVARAIGELRRQTGGFELVRVESSDALSFVGLVRKQDGDRIARVDLALAARTPARLAVR